MEAAGHGIILVILLFAFVNFVLGVWIKYIGRPRYVVRLRRRITARIASERDAC